jgi:Tfp pilus assembly protein FimT
MIRLTKGRLAWLLAELALVAVILAVLAAILMPVFVGPLDPTPELRDLRE